MQSFGTTVKQVTKLSLWGDCPSGKLLYNFCTFCLGMLITNIDRREHFANHRQKTIWCLVVSTHLILVWSCCHFGARLEKVVACRTCSSISQPPDGALPSSAAGPEPVCPVFASLSGAGRSPPSPGCMHPGGLTESPVTILTRLSLLQGGRPAPLTAPGEISGPPSQDLNLLMDNWLL